MLLIILHTFWTSRSAHVDVTCRRRLKQEIGSHKISKTRTIARFALQSRVTHLCFTHRM